MRGFFCTETSENKSYPLANCDKASLEYKVVWALLQVKNLDEIVYITADASVPAGDIISQIIQVSMSCRIIL